jgi:cytochrome c biogenesis protein CcmG/thiol:disulfide interchange protein DsbE
MLRYTIPLIVFIGLVLFFASGLKRDPRQVPSPFIGKPAPEIGVSQLKIPDKKIYRSDLLGKAALVNVWASWCVACRAEHEVLLRLARETRLPIIGLNYKDKREAALQWLVNLGNPYTAVAVDADGRVGMNWGVYGVPESFLLDPQGIIRYKQIGPLTWNAVEEKLLPLIQSFETHGG